MRPCALKVRGQLGNFAVGQDSGLLRPHYVDASGDEIPLEQALKQRKKARAAVAAKAPQQPPGG